MEYGEEREVGRQSFVIPGIGGRVRFFLSGFSFVPFMLVMIVIVLLLSRFTAPELLAIIFNGIFSLLCGVKLYVYEVTSNTESVEGGFLWEIALSSIVFRFRLRFFFECHHQSEEPKHFEHKVGRFSRSDRTRLR